MKILKNLIKNLIGGVACCGLCMLFLRILSLLVEVVQAHTWLLIPLGVVAFGLMFKLSDESE